MISPKRKLKQGYEYGRKNVRLLKKIVVISKPERISLFISHHFIMPMVISRIDMTKTKFMLFILPALYDVLNAVALQNPRLRFTNDT
jgi:hypothetical protein